MKQPIHHIQFNRSMIFIAISCILGWFSSCKEPDPFPTTPSISFKDLRFVQDSIELDSLILEFNFEDGDGDLGFYVNETSPPYHDVDYIVDSDDIPVTLNGDHSTPFYRFTPQEGGTLSSTQRNIGSFEFFSDTDNRPAYSCQDYDTLRLGEQLDTLFVVRNHFRYNLYLKFFWNRGEGFEELDFEYLNSPQFGCGENFNGKFPVWDASNIGTSLQGYIKYSMTSNGFDITFRTTPFKIQFYIYDRATNISNIVETPEYTLGDITVVQ